MVKDKSTWTCVTCGVRGANMHIVYGYQSPIPSNKYQGQSYCSWACVAIYAEKRSAPCPTCGRER